MARLLRLQYPGAIYHVMCRGNERRAIFKGEADRRRLLQQMAVARDLYQARFYLVCLMPNHVHLLLETPLGNLSALMGQLLTAYTVYFNRRYRRAGHLFQGRYRSQVVEGDAYLLKLSRYIHLNPVCGRRWQGEAGAVRRQALRAYAASTYGSYVGLEPPWPWIDYAPLQALVAVPGASPQAGYRAYVESGLAESDEAFRRLYRTSRLGVGSAEFVTDMRRQYQAALGKRRRPEDAILRRVVAVRPVAEVLEVVARVMGVTIRELQHKHRHSWLRGAAAWALVRHGGLDQRAVAAAIGMRTGAAVSQQLRKWRATSKPGTSWHKIAAEIERQLGTAS
jgi:REP element-mobilizing transposase RayT